MKGVTVCSNLFSCGVIGRRSSGRSDVTVMSQSVLLLLSVGCGGIWTPLTANPSGGPAGGRQRSEREGASLRPGSAPPPSGSADHLQPQSLSWRARSQASNTGLTVGRQAVKDQTGVSAPPPPPPPGFIVSLNLQSTTPHLYSRSK